MYIVKTWPCNPVLQQPNRFLSSLLERLPVFRVVFHPPLVSGPINAGRCAGEVYAPHSAELFDDTLARTLQMSYTRHWLVNQFLQLSFLVPSPGGEPADHSHRRTAR